MTAQSTAIELVTFKWNSNIEDGFTVSNQVMEQNRKSAFEFAPWKISRVIAAEEVRNDPIFVGPRSPCLRAEVLDPLLLNEFDDVACTRFAALHCKKNARFRKEEANFIGKANRDQDVPLPLR